MKIYIAHNYTAREELLRMVVPKLLDLGHTITSTWMKGNEIGESGAKQDLAELTAADAILIYTDQAGNTPGRGKWVELGYALAKDKRVFAIGFDLNCIFLHLSQVKRICTLEEIK